MGAEQENLFLSYTLVARVWTQGLDFAETAGMYTQLLAGEGWVQHREEHASHMFPLSGP